MSDCDLWSVAADQETIHMATFTMFYTCLLPLSAGGLRFPTNRQNSIEPPALSVPPEVGPCTYGHRMEKSSLIARRSPLRIPALLLDLAVR
ncbi:hypothetical protein G7K_0371-t1 [Saitoella complicata NRRL Y-17804]|uniref:Uncharacterized protein n=1 Tax=Saitoella complicata (strain BCRC 22490 / CBS 7301 / JCM 7358 / NBRC 10748 / NRRL Y-17804) TaxID=698492 RepID=A0A0E9N897_SAICN|nr:hypothetical protein G7K_0371-t1 [Saitoella complicata NRRL Y-17804]